MLAVREEGWTYVRRTESIAPLPFIFLRIYLINAGIRLFPPLGKKLKGRKEQAFMKNIGQYKRKRTCFFPESLYNGITE
uniref:hypothetical protein n=1 Tax=Enterocloster clostridioformis TaxID=1531 RepID=UPI0026E99859|nr:hypothetical protein [Enterocloster clostridioformis]